MPAGPGGVTVGWMDGTWFRRNLRYLLVDFHLSAAFIAVFLASADHWAGTPPSPHRAVDAPGYALLIGIAVVLLARRWAPRPTLALEGALVGAFLGLGYPEGPYFIALAVAGFTVGRGSPRRIAALAAVCMTCLLAAGEATSYGRGLAGGGWDLAAGLGAALLVGSGPVVVGSLAREHRAWRVTAEAEARQRLIDAERLRMAREVHDVVGHSLSIISLQAGVALHVLDRRPEQAQLSLEAIRRTSVEALDELRATLALTRAGQTAADHTTVDQTAGGRSTLPERPGGSAVPVQPSTAAGEPDRATAQGPATCSERLSDPAAAPAAPGGPTSVTASAPRPPLEVSAHPAERAPLTGLRRLPGLLAEVRLCGVPVEAETSGPLGELPADVDLAAFRIVQESLTNVLRHARGARVAVRLRVDAAAVTIEVADTPPRRRDPAPSASRSAVHGLIGLRERAEELGGWLDAGPCAEGGWRVRAWLPRRAAPVVRSGA